MEYLYIVLLLLCSAFCSGTEIAYTSLNKLKLRKENEKPSSTQRLVNYIYNHYDNALSTILIGNNLVNIAATSVATVIAVNLAKTLALSEDGVSSAVTVIMTVLILIFGEITPKMIARRCSDKFASLAAYPLIVLMVVFFPAVWITGLVVKLFSLMWRNKEDQNVTITEEDLETILDTAEDAGVIDEAETELLQSALEFSDLTAADILTPRIDVVGFELNDTLEHVLTVINETQFSRYPVYDRTVDHVVGILYAKHLLKELVERKDVKLEELLLEPAFIPKSMNLHAIMNEFRKTRTHMAVVADEYGGITGIVTMEDVLEQLVGEIWDENDDIVNDWQELATDRYECAGDLNLAEFCNHLDLDDEDIDTLCATVGGWATETLGAMPVPFDSFDYDRFTMMVKEVDENHRIIRLLILAHHFTEEE